MECQKEKEKKQFWKKRKKLIGLGTKMLCNLWNEVVNIIMYLKNISPIITNFWNYTTTKNLTFLISEFMSVQFMFMWTKRTMKA